MRKKKMKQAGWQVVGDRKEGDGEHQLLLQNPDGEQMSVKASTRARAYLRAEQELRVKT